MTVRGPISQGQRVRIERRPTRSLATYARPRTALRPAPWPEVWEGTVLQVAYEDDELTDVEIYGKRESTGETKRVSFSLARNTFFRTTVTPAKSS
ncbi:hypothetical protein [Streptomyces rhizosphaerihabitans]|uniref:hypothetical protein n=1 Tax=Streptomyces rhizosphaerihabitans TaxID=1266770 RepID=UPI0021C1FB9B|nr:hypothetical protein [Streptomyces rhizosphaerihabitans]MCT9011524.1 hypothetical protein [Streptomyces rhizosphaerihabitans]